MAPYLAACRAYSLRDTMQRLCHSDLRFHSTGIDIHQKLPIGQSNAPGELSDTNKADQRSAGSDVVQARSIGI